MTEEEFEKFKEDHENKINDLKTELEVLQEGNRDLQAEI